MNDNSLQVSFLPWFKLNKNLTIGAITFWPYFIESNQRINNPQIKGHLDKYFESYVDHSGKPVDTITVCSKGDIDFHKLDDSEIEELINAVNILIFATIAPQVKNSVCADNRSYAPSSSETFGVVTQKFSLDSRFISVREGSFTSGGWKIGKITFSKPWTSAGILSKPEETLIQGFNKCFNSVFPKDSRERLFLTLEWFRLAHVESDNISLFSKVVMMTTCFEILLRFPKDKKRNHFVEYMEKNIASSKFNKDIRINHWGKNFTLTLAGCWAWDFYELRNRIVHGDTISFDDLRYRDWISYLIVADLVLLECIKRELFFHKCIGDDIHSYTSDVTVHEQLIRYRFNDIHKTLGWITKDI